MHKKMLAIACLTLAGLAMDAAAQTALQPGTIVGTFQANAQLQNTSSVLYTAPPDRNARVTDIVVMNLQDNDCVVNVTAGTTTLWIQLPAGRNTIAVPLNSGIGLPAGTTIEANRSVNCVANQAYVQVRGFNFTIP